MEIDNIDDLLKNLKAQKIIGVDGCDGAGKTCLSKEIAKIMNWSILNLDKFVEKDKGNYVKNLRLQEVQQYIDTQNKPLIIEGVCLLEILRKIRITADYIVYVKKVNDRGDWLDEDKCLIVNSPEETIRDLEEQTRVVFPEFEGLSPLTKEIIIYHKIYAPLESANCIYNRVKNN